MTTNIYSFENEINADFYCSNSSMHLSQKHFKDGESSLCWEVKQNSVLGIKAPIGYMPFKEGSLDQARDSFVVWIYCEKPHPNETLRFDFLKQGSKCAYFYFQLDFVGWRTAWVPYESMEGKPVPEMDEIRITANIKEPCTLYLDQMIVCVPIDPRHPTRDQQVPFINTRADQAANSHWLSLYRFNRLKEEAMSNLSPKLISNGDISKVTKRFEAYILSHSPYENNEKMEVSEEQIKTLISTYEKFRISNTSDYIVGTIINADCHIAAFPKQNKEELITLTDAIDIKDCSEWLLDMAYAWHAGNAMQKQLLGDLFINVFRHLINQGWAHGSSMGTTHHLGYPMRSYYKALFLMRQPLCESGYLGQASSAMAWFAGMGRIFRGDEELQGESMDTLNTLVQGILGSILMMEKREEIHLCLSAMKHWLSTCMLPAPGLRGPFKVDGSAFHHCNHYPAYAMGGFTGVAPIVYFLSQTVYEISEEAHRTMRKSLLYMRLYCNHTNWLVSMSARHPRGVGEMSQISTLEPFYYMALAGTPGSTHIVDKEMAEALLRLAQYSDDPKAKEFLKMGYQPELAPTGHFTMNYACATLHRRAHWLAGVRGHSRYIWGNETYLRNNLYGRYIAYGNLQILGSGTPINNTDSGFYQEGWDWNCWPGTTAVHLPFDELRANVCNVDTLSGFEEMLISDEKFAGGTSIKGENGMFAMKLHGHGKYDPSHRALKSYFFFDNRIVCIGTGIENINNKYETRTTLFQNYLSDEMKPVYINTNKPITGLETDFTNNQEALWIRDNLGNTYYIPKGQMVKVTRSMQESRAQDTGLATFAPFVKAWIDHGIAPNKGYYEYMIIVGDETLGSELDMMPYKVLQADEFAHIVQDTQSGILGYAFYETDQPVSYGYVQCVSMPSLIMEQMEEDTLCLSICDPDLRLYEGVEEDQVTPDGIQKEVSLYSREWRKEKSIGKKLNVTLQGYWELAFPVEGVCIAYENEKSILTVYCIEAQPVELELRQQGK